MMEKGASAIEAAGKELAFGAVSESLETLIAPLDKKQRTDLLAFLSTKV